MVQYFGATLFRIVVSLHKICGVLSLCTHFLYPSIRVRTAHPVSVTVRARVTPVLIFFNFLYPSISVRTAHPVSVRARARASLACNNRYLHVATSLPALCIFYFSVFT